jgi:hypothetical protein
MKKYLICIQDEEIFESWRKLIEELGYKSYSERLEQLVTSDLIALQLTQSLIKKEKGEKNE